jgi:RNA polymerase sigma factor (sigma-70 family)
MVMLETCTDAEAIAASTASPDRFGEIFDRHFVAVHRFVQRRVGRSIADDVAAEVFVQAFRGRDRYDGSPDARPWLLGIAVNLLRRHYRSERRQLIAYERTGVDLIADSGLIGAEERADAAQMGRRLALALSSLRDADRDALLLYAWADLDYQEIARALGVRVGTVRSRLHRARRRLRAQLQAPAGSESHYLQGEEYPR